MKSKAGMLQTQRSVDPGKAKLQLMHFVQKIANVKPRPERRACESPLYRKAYWT